MRRKLKLNYAFGIGFLILGFTFIGLNYYLLTSSEYYYPKRLFQGIVCSFLGVGLILFPGGDIPDHTPKNQSLVVFWKMTKSFNKAMWITFAIIGVIVATICKIYLED